MAESFVIPLRVSGLVKADFGFRLYLDGARQSGDEAAITVTELGGVGDYLVDGLPDAASGEHWAATWEYPAGTGAAYYWTHENGGTPTAVVIPYRTTGAVEADFDLHLYREGVTRADDLTVAEINSGAGDYSVTGWPTAAPTERWLLTWAIAGIAYHSSWTGTATLSAESTYVDERVVVANVLDGFTAGVPVLWPDTVDDPPSPGTDPASPVSYLVAEVEHDRAELVDMAGGAQIDGRVTVGVWVERDAGDELVREHVDTLRGLFAVGDDTTVPIYFLEPLVGAAQIGGANGEWYGRRVDVPFVRFT